MGSHNVRSDMLCRQGSRHPRSTLAQVIQDRAPPWESRRPAGFRPNQVDTGTWQCGSEQYRWHVVSTGSRRDRG